MCANKSIFLAHNWCAAPLATAVSASLGVASGSLVFDASRAAELAARGQQVILARPVIDTADVQGIAAAEGIVTSTGGRTSHAAVVARQFGKVCLVGCSALQVQADGTGCTIGARRFSEGEEITLDGEGGRVYAGLLPLIHERPESALKALASWPA